MTKIESDWTSSPMVQSDQSGMSSDRCPAVIQTLGLGRVFQTDDVDTHALADIDLRISEGEFVSITGPSGCGKSTLMAILGLLDAPTSGSYRLHGLEVASMDGGERARVRNLHIGYVFQAFNLIGDLTIVENVELPLRFRSGMSKAERRDRAMTSLNRMEMSHRARHFPSQLSGGQQQRVAIARALVGDPVIVLADEPTGNLDSRNGSLVMDLLQELHASGTTLCMVTHDPNFAAIAQRSVYMNDGRVVS